MNEILKSGGAGGAKLAVSKSVNKGKRNVVRRALDVKKVKDKKKNKSKSPRTKKSDPKEETKEDKLEQIEEKKEEEEEKDLYVDLSLAQINKLKNDIESEAFQKIRDTYSGAGVNAAKITPLCKLLSLRFNAEDPIETYRKIFSKTKARVSHLINLDEEEDP